VPDYSGFGINVNLVAMQRRVSSHQGPKDKSRRKCAAASLCWADLSCWRIKSVGKSHCITALEIELAFVDPMHKSVPARTFFADWND
jgi:hypothetical protein